MNSKTEPGQPCISSSGYHRLFTELQAEKQKADPDFQPLNIACVFSPPAEGDPDVKQI